MKKSGGSAFGIIFIVIMLALFLSMCGSMGGSSSSNSGSSSSKTCQSCGRSFDDSINKKYITHTNMCKNCYTNFCWATGKTPTNYG